MFNQRLVVRVFKLGKNGNPKILSSYVTSSVSISVPPLFIKSGNLVQSSLNVVDINKSVYVFAFKTAIAPDVASEVTTSLIQPDHIKFESESESAFDNGKSQCKMVFVCDEKDGS